MRGAPVLQIDIVHYLNLRLVQLIGCPIKGLLYPRVNSSWMGRLIRFLSLSTLLIFLKQQLNFGNQFVLGGIKTGTMIYRKVVALVLDIQFIR